MYNIILYEDNRFPELYPLTYLRPVWDLRCGAFSLKERLSKGLKSDKIYQWTSRERSAFASGLAVAKGPVILVNGRAFVTRDEIGSLLKVRGNSVILSGGFIAALKLENSELLVNSLSGEPTERSLQQLAEGAREMESPYRLSNHLWDLVDLNGAAIELDAAHFKPGTGKLPKGVNLLGKRSNLKLAAQAVIEPGVVIDVRHGPVIIEPGAVIRPFSLIEGPCYIGHDSLVDGAKLRPGVSAGRGCKLAGEIERSVILDFTNKHHDGFLGHSYLGSWVNLGAMTANSDLKNNYGNITIWAGGRYVDSERMKAGCFIGDHTKTAIGTMINTGAVIGLCCNIFGGSVRKYLPSFSWGCSDRFHDHQLEKALATCRTVMGRRKQGLSPRDVEIMKKVFVQTAADRAHISGGKNR